MHTINNQDFIMKNRCFPISFSIFFYIASALPGAAPLRTGTASPEVAGIATDLSAFAQAEMKAQKVPGLAFALVQKDKVIFAEGYGVKSLGGSDPVGARTVFEVGSTTKAFTSALLGILVDRGRLQWSDRVVSSFPRFRLWDSWATREFRVDDLMAQWSGMPGYSLNMMALLGWTRDDLAAAVVSVRPVYSPRSQFSYVNTLWIWAGRLVERYSGLSWEEAMAREILTPLGMRDSTVDPRIVPFLNDAAAGHMVFPDGNVWRIPSDWPYRGWLDTFGPAGSLRSNVLDMSKWVRMHLSQGTFEGQRILTAATLARLHAPRSLMSAESARTLSYAQGWCYDVRPAGPVIWHNGGTAGMHSIVALYPAADTGLVVLTNTDSNSIPEDMDARLYPLLFPGAAGRALSPTPAELAALNRIALPGLIDSREPPPLASATRGMTPPLPLARYTGRYSNPAYETIQIRLKAGGLAAVVGPKQYELPLAHLDGHTFSMTIPDWPQSESAVHFVFEDGENASRVQFELFGDVREGWCERVEP